MNETSKLWQQIAPSEFPLEREALAFVRQELPDYEPYRAWANLEFIAEDGSIHEVDLLVLTPKGFFLVEIKSWDGTLEGDSQTWVLHRDGRVHTHDSPLLLANRKARKLASLLKKQKAAQGDRLPYLTPVVFLSSPGLRCKLTGTARQGVYLRDRAADGSQPARPGILAALTQLDPNERAAAGKPRIDRPAAKRVQRALDEAGIRPTQRARRVGDYQLDSLLFSGPNYQDWQAHHVTAERLVRRVRIYSGVSGASGGKAGAEARAQLERAARREVEALEPISHEGLLKPLQLTTHELGPALVFEHDPKALRLDHFLAQAGSRLSFDTRLSLVRQIAETLRFVHDQRLFHRSLAPQSVLVWNPDSNSPRLRILNWQTAVHEGLTPRSTQTGLTGTSNLDQLVEDNALVYVAPEALTVPGALPEPLDVFSLGALAYFLLSGKPPAESVLDLHERLKAGPGLQLPAALDGVHPWLGQLIQNATHPVVGERTPSVADFLSDLDRLEEDLTRPDFLLDPLAARAGDRLADGFLVKKRLGQGSSAVVYLVERHGREQVLKLALDPGADERLQAEAEVLRRLDHPRIVRLQDTVTLGGRFGLLLARVGDRAGERTIAQRLRDEGPFQLELLQRFGEDLLEAVAYLEQAGVPHRDIKPDNLGVTEAGRNSELHAVLLDFSLARTPAENIFAGTRPYLDPFLRERKPRRWDLQAERFAAAVTLYEMATGTLPRWGDGRSDPGMTEDEARIEPEMLDAAVRAPLAAFFAQALRRNPRKRFDNAAEMLAAWRRAFTQAGRPSTTTATDVQPDELARACALASLDTPVALLHLSTRAVNALERVQVVLVRDLLRLPASQIQRMRGVGHKTRKELGEAIRHLSGWLGRPETLDDLPPAAVPEADAEPTVVSLDLLVRQLLPGPKSPAAGERRILESLFGLSLSPEAPRPLALWPSQTEAAESLGLTRARVSQVLMKARPRWERNPSVTLLRDDVARLLNAQAGVMTVQELYAALLASRGSAQEEPRRTLHAAAALRAATETEESRKAPRWRTRRTGDLVLLALAELDAEALFDYVAALGRKADELAKQDPLPSPQRALEVLQDVPRPPRSLPFSAERLLRLATAASQNAALSARLEIYPRRLPAARALRLASGTLLSTRALTVEQVRDRVASRFPEAERLPGRPQLDGLLSEALRLTWDPNAEDGRGAYVFPALPSASLTASTTFGRGRTAPGAGTDSGLGEELPPEKLDARLFDERLTRAARDGAFLAVHVDRRVLRRVEQELARRFPVELVSLEQRWIAAMRRLAAENEVDWDFVLRADALPSDHPDAQQLRRFARKALEEVEAGLAGAPGTVLLTRPGLLARYDPEMGFLGRLRERITHPAPGANALHGLWLLVAGDGLDTGPRIDGTAVPVLPWARWVRVPDAWIPDPDREVTSKETA